MKKIFSVFFISICSLLASPSIFGYKPYNELKINTVNLNDYPKKISHYGPDMEVTIGDLHGNALKLLYFLISNDVMRLSEKDYQRFVTIYKKSPIELTHKDIALFHTIINSAYINSAHKLRFLGDDLCDRGMNDYYTLQIYKKLDLAHAPFEIVLSNHGNFFLTAYERPEQSFSYNPYGEGRHESIVRSMLNLGKLIDKGLVDKGDILEIVQTHYLKHLVLPGVTINKANNEITIYTHAPIDVSILSRLAGDLGIDYQDDNLEIFVKTIADINSKIQGWILQNTFSSNYKHLNELHDKEKTPSAIRQVLWNRDYSILDRQYQPEGKSFGINYVHGHDSQPNVFDLDNLFGKGQDNDRGPYAIYITHPVSPN